MGKGLISTATEFVGARARDLVMFIRKNDGRLPRPRRGGEFGNLHDGEVRLIERIVGDAFAGFSDARLVSSGRYRADA
jgi:hypothetical protein